MSFSDAQLRQLKAPVRRRYVKERQADGKTLHYLEGWWVVSEANRIFGFDAWERETVSSECVWRSPVDDRFAAAYLTRVRVSVRAGDRVIVREGLGGGEAIAPTPGQAHEWASKAAETDATKRALSTFGSRFGLSLYGERGEKTPHERVPLGRAAARVVKTVDDRMRAAARAEATDFRRGARNVSELEKPDAAGALGERARINDAGWRSTRGSHPFMRGPLPEPKQNATPQPHDVEGAARVSAAGNEVRSEDTISTAAPPQQTVVGPDVEQHSGAEQPSSTAEPASELPLFKQEDGGGIALLPVRLPSPSDPQPLTGRVDKSVLALPEPRRIRDRHHLKFVASQPRVVCARTPSQAHHLRIAQQRALGRKVSDEFTVPLCASHHHDLHMKGNEAKWWWGHTIDPLPIAERLWLANRSGIKPQDTNGSSSAAE